MLLGGLRYLLPVIKAAHSHGIYVITVDYIPDNIAHKYSDEYHNVSILDKDAVLSLARRLEIDGIMSFAVDPGVITAAYVAEKMGLPFQCSYEAACILQDKARFREFLSKHNFNVPFARGYDNAEAALKDVRSMSSFTQSKASFTWPLIVKPVDSAGSKGVSKVDSYEELPAAIDFALSESHNGHFIIEDFLEKEGNSSDSDCFTIDGKLVFCSFSDQYFDKDAKNPYTPAAYAWPSTILQSAQEELQSELQRLFTLLEVKTGIYNVETRLCKNGKAYIMEVSPRGGGNRLAEMLKYATGTDLIDNYVRAMVGIEVDPIEAPRYDGSLYEMIVHSEADGTYNGLNYKASKIDKIDLRHYLVEEDMWVERGDPIEAFSGANKAIGTLVFKFPNFVEKSEQIRRIKSDGLISVEVKN